MRLVTNVTAAMTRPYDLQKIMLTFNERQPERGHS